jgi:eukaryotic-like serine/threonine-protein kinase
MAEIFLATRPTRHGGRDFVCIKRLHPEDADDATIVRMFVDESLLSLRLRHPNIVRTDALGLIENRHALVMEYLEGQPLHTVLKRCAELGRRLPLEVILPAFADVLDGLHYAHELESDDGRRMNVIHRDVSPHNLFVTTSGNLKLLDFGIAKTRVQENHTRTGILKGKVAYMAPEQAHGTGIDHRADLWSAGVTLWEAIAGVRLFKADNEAASLRLTLGGPIPSLSELRPDVPREIELLVMRALRRDPNERFPTAKAMADGLRAWGEKRQLAITAPMRDLMAELFGREIAEHRVKIRALAAGGGEPIPISGTVPTLSRRIAAAETNVETHVSTISDVVDRLHQDQRAAFRWMYLVLGFLASAVIVLGIAFLTRTRENPAKDQAAARPDVAAKQAPERATAPVSPAAQAPLRPVVEPIGTVTAAPPAASVEQVRAADLATERPHGRVARGAAAPPQPAREPVPEAPPAAPAVAPVTARPSAEFGFLTLDTTPWSEVRVNGVSLGQTPIVRAKLPPGPHTVLLVNGERGLSTTYQVTIEAGKTSSRRLALD